MIKKKILVISSVAVICLMLFAVLTILSSVITDEEENVEEPISGNAGSDSNERSYMHLLDFPFREGIDLVNEDAFSFIKNEYDKLDFHTEFNVGNVEVYDYYKEKFLKLLNNKVSFWDRETNQYLYLNDINELSANERDGYGLDTYSYLFFDMNGDEMPELCITDISRFRYIFIYYPEADEYVLWYGNVAAYYSIMGTQKMAWNRGGDRHVFYVFDEKGNQDYFVYFFQYAITNIEEETEWTYMVALLEYGNKEEQVEVTEEMKRQGYFVENMQIYYYGVTKEQYHLLLADYFVEYDLAIRNRKAVTYTYDELFGGIE